MRHKIIRLISTALVLMGSAVAQVEAAPILWDSGTGSNGNAYEYIAGTITWSAAKAAAEGMTFNGATGHLVTLHSNEEASFINPLYSSDPNTAVFGPWIGLNDIAVEGTYAWVTGEAYTYSNFSAGEPNNVGNEDGIHFWGAASGRPLGSWNDWQIIATNGGGYIVEFESSEMASVPEPAVFSLLLLGLAGMRYSSKKRKA